MEFDSNMPSYESSFCLHSSKIEKISYIWVTMAVILKLILCKLNVQFLLKWLTRAVKISLNENKLYMLTIHYGKLLPCYFVNMWIP